MTQLGIVSRALTSNAWKTLALAAAVAAAPAAASGQHASGGHSSMPHGSSAAAAKDIVQVASEAGSFNTLVTAIKAAGLVETLQGKGPFTVFAPSDAAFAKLPQGTVEALLADKTALTALLTFHVVPGRVMAADVVQANGAMPRTVNGQPLDIKVRGGKVYVNGAQVTTADVAASNGVIHVIDTVLQPSAATSAAPAGR